MTGHNDKKHNNISHLYRCLSAFKLLSPLGRHLTVAGVLTVTASIAHGAQVEAKKDGVQVFADAQNKSAVMATMKKGDQLEAKERKGMYWEVKLPGGKAGFVSVIAVQHKPGEGSSGLNNAIRNAVTNSRPSTDGTAATRQRSAVMGVRGLDESGSTAFAGNVKPNLRSVFAMEDRVVSANEIESLGNLVMNEIGSKQKQ